MPRVLHLLTAVLLCSCLSNATGESLITLFPLDFIYMLCIYAIKTYTVTLTSSAESACPGDTVVFTCVTDTGRLIWAVSSMNQVHSFHSINQIETILTMQIFKLELANVSGIDNKIYLSAATVHNVLPDYNNRHYLRGW